MKPHTLYSVFAAAVCFATPTGRAAPSATITVDAGQPGHAISPLLWGIFFEDINLSADGGIYAELVRNRSFEDGDKPDHWTLLARGEARAEMSVESDPGRGTFNTRSLKVAITAPGVGRAGVANGGYWGIPVRKGAGYRLSLIARGAPDFSGPLNVTLESAEGVVYGQGTVARLTGDWKTYDLPLKSSATDPKARLVIGAERPGTFWLDYVSLFPKDTWKGRPNGLRPDLAEMLAALKPAFVRFPGGCWVEGDTMKEAYRWKQTIGHPSQRRTQWNIWGYHATHGIGYHEYLQLCEDLGAEPLFVINCGMSHKEVVPLEQMDEFVQDALDALEYADGPVTSRWGAERAQAGHPAPFRMKYLEIGNENGGRAYNERYALFYQAIKTRHPDVTLIANDWGGIPKETPVEIVDEHYYNSPAFFLGQSGKYDSYDRAGHKVYVGEYAVTSGAGQGNRRGAVGEAAFMLGMERNSDVVVMASYAPLFVHVNHRRWNPDLINFDNSRAYGIPSYYVQQLFSLHRGDVVLPTTLALTEEAPPEPRRGAVGLGTWLTQAEYKDLRVTQGGRVLFASDFAGGAEGWKVRSGDWKVVEGAYRQSSGAENVQAHAGDPAWADYTLTVKARKLGGAEGFLIMFHVADADNWVWWNLGGWGNQRHALEHCVGGGKSILGREVNGRIETGRWYDIRIETQGQNVKCFLDGRLSHDANFGVAQSLFASASLDRKAGEIILKVVNAAAGPREAAVRIDGARVASTGKAFVLTSEKPTDENSLDHPTKVAPVSAGVKGLGAESRQTFPGNSLTVLRLKARR